MLSSSTMVEVLQGGRNRDHFFDHLNVTVKTRVVDHHQSYQVPETGWWFNDVIVFEYWGR